MLRQPKLEISDARKLLRSLLRTEFTAKLADFDFHPAPDLTKQGGGYERVYNPTGYWKRMNKNGSLTTIGIQMEKSHRPSFTINFKKWETKTPALASQMVIRVPGVNGEQECVEGWQHWKIAGEGRLIPTRIWPIQKWFSASWPHRRSDKRIRRIVDQASRIVPALVDWSEQGTLHRSIDDQLWRDDAAGTHWDVLLAEELAASKPSQQ